MPDKPSATRDAPSATRDMPSAMRDTASAISDTQIAEWEAEFKAAARRSLALRMKYSFIRTYKPVLDDAPYRSFETMAEYRDWCEKNLPSWLGYGRSL